MFANRHVNRGIEDTLRISLIWGIGWVFGMGVLLVALAHPQVALADRLRLLYLTIFFYTGAALAWVTNDWRPSAGRWLLPLSAIMLVTLGIGWLQEPGFWALLTVPIVLARALNSLRAAALTASLGSALILVWPRLTISPLGDAAPVFALVAMWTTVGLMYAIYRPMHRITSWALEHYEQARHLLEESRDRKAELQAARDDLVHINRELTLLNERLQLLRQEADTARKAKALFVAKVSHEFRTPLNMIIGLADLLIETPEIYGEKLPNSLLDDLKIVQRNCQHLAHLVEDVLSLGQIEAGQLTIHRAWVNLSEDIDTVVAIVRPLVDKKMLYLTVDCDPKVPPVNCDRTRIRQVLLNLVSNAARFTEKGGVTIRLTRNGNDVIMSVADTGPGIAPEESELIFEPFVQSSRPSNGGGSGLGLSISRQFVELHHGRIWLESTPGRGTTFFVQIPISPPAHAEPTPRRWLNEEWIWQQRITPLAAPKSPYRERVMVYDVPKTLDAIASRLGQDVEIVTVKSLEEAEQELRRVPAHLLIVNVDSAANLLPTAEQAQRLIADTPIIVCAYPSPLARVLEADAMGFLSKPVTADKLVGAIKGLERPIRKILIVDDNRDVQELLTRLLLTFDPALTIETVADGADVLERMRHLMPDLVLLDLSLPHLDGWEILALKAKDPQIRSIATYIVSAQDIAPPGSSLSPLIATMQNGLSVDTFLRCALAFSQVMLVPT